jgi:hypothetical protein
MREAVLAGHRDGLERGRRPRAAGCGRRGKGGRSATVAHRLTPAHGRRGAACASHHGDGPRPGKRATRFSARMQPPRKHPRRVDNDERCRSRVAGVSDGSLRERFLISKYTCARSVMHVALRLV